MKPRNPPPEPIDGCCINCGSRELRSVKFKSGTLHYLCLTCGCSCGSKCPTPEEIVRTCAEIKRGVSDTELLKRAGGIKQRVETPVVDLYLSDKPGVEPSELEMP